MKTRASESGFILARQIGRSYSENPKVAAVIAGGSVARGCADQYSDLEIGVFWSEPPSDLDRRAVIARTGGDVWRFESYDSATKGAAVEHLGLTGVELAGKRYTGTLMVSVQHLTVRSVQACLADVVDGCDPAIAKQNLVSAIQHSVPFHGADMVLRWQAKAAIYPDALARNMVREYLWLGPWFYPEVYASRDDRLILTQHLCETTRRLLNVLMGLNRIYHPSSEYKWVDRLAREMRIAPTDFAVRLKRVFQHDLLAGARELIKMVQETLSLIERHMPEIDTSRERKRWVPSCPYTLLHTIAADSAEGDEEVPGC